MPRTINFVQETAKRVKVQDEQDAHLFRRVVQAVMVVVVIWGVAMASQLAMNWRLNRANAEFEQTKQSLELSKEIQDQYARFSAKVTVLTELFTDRRNKQDALVFFRSLFTDGVTISGLVYDDAKKALTFSLTTDSVFVLETVLERLDSPQTRAQYPNISLASLRRGSDGKYTLNVSVVL